MRSRLSLPITCWALGLFCLSQSPTVLAQTPITAFSAGYQTQSSSISSYNAMPATNSSTFASCVTTTYTYTFSNTSSNQYKLSGFTAGSNNYVIAPISAASVKLRRVNNANVSGTRNIVYMETTASTAAGCPANKTLAFKPPYVDSMEILLGAGNLNQGTDNIFTNASNSDGNNNDIERVDVIFANRLNTISPTEAGFAVFDRGADYGHDPFKIVAITSLDSTGTPNGFGPVQTCIGGNGTNSNGDYGHPSDANGNLTFASFILRKDPSDTYLRVSSDANQEIGGVFYSFADLGIGAGDPLYGYALLGPDGIASPTSAQLLALTNSSVYPTNTTEAAGGGLDLVAVNCVFTSGSYDVLDVNIESFTGSVQNGAATLQWKISGNTPYETLTLQRSSDGYSYQSLFSQTPAADSIYIDHGLSADGITYYRLSITSASGATSYSNVLTLHSNALSTASWKAFPSIITNGQSLHLQGLTDGTYQLSLFDVAGSCQKMTAYVQGGEAQIVIPQNGLAAGIYWLSLSQNRKTVPGNGKIFIR